MDNRQMGSSQQMSSQEIGSQFSRRVKNRSSSNSRLSGRE
jgi:hypothetical protein